MTDEQRAMSKSQLARLSTQVPEIAKLQAELQAAEARLASAVGAERERVSIPVKSLLAIRDALVEGDTDEAYHQLYSAVPWKDPYHPWVEWEAIRALTNDGAAWER